tara:strand:+ start:366 stop:1355 length:990 start_codon:yes stop_codon:yes gene_type:complete
MGIEISDVVGLSQPITKLIEVTSAGLGRSTEDFFRLRKAKTFAKELEIITSAFERHGKALGSVKFTREDIELISKETGLDLYQAEEYSQLMQRASSNDFSRNVKKQANTESVLSHAAEELREETEVPDTEVDQDWLSLYFSIVENVSSDYMHQLWGKVLAGEIRTPGGFSLRTLELLKTMTVKEAELFSKVVEKSVLLNNRVIIIHKENWSDFYSGLSFLDYNFLEQIGLIQTLSFDFRDLKKGSKIIINNNGVDVVGIEFEEDVKRFSIPYTDLTKIGEDIFALIQYKNESYENLINFAKKITINNKYKLFKGRFVDSSKKSFSVEYL